MSVDAALAVVHHLAVFSLLGVLAAEWGLVRAGMSSTDVARVGRIDAGYGAAAVAVLLAGVARLVWGEQPFSYYAENPVFWLKMAGFATVGTLSVGPTRRYLAWRGAEVAPAAAEVEAVRRRIHLQLAIFPVIPIAAALMARGIGL